MGKQLVSFCKVEVGLYVSGHISFYKFFHLCIQGTRWLKELGSWMS
jgi:hypothetical protein